MSYRIRQLQLDDISDAMRLKNAAGWNQVEDDWRAFLTLAPGGCFALECDGRVVATATAVPYETRFGWIGMMLVDPDYRRRGFGTAMLERAVEYLESRGLDVLLDATPEGRLVYDQHDFHQVFELERWAGVSHGSSCAERIGTLAPEDIGVLAKLDREHFGASRLELLAEITRRAPEFAFVSERDGGVDGYLLARRGSRYVHLGPGVAREPKVGLRLLDHGLHVMEGDSVCVDIPRRRADLREHLAAHGLDVIRPLIRMIKSRDGESRRADRNGAIHGGDPKTMSAAAGPEWG